MANILQMVDGAAIKEGTLEDNQGLMFPNDGINNRGSWTRRPQ